MVAILDYDAGNIKSVQKAIEFLGEDAVLTRDPKVILSADHVILPGVGSFGDAMEKLHKYDLVSVIHQVIEEQIPFLGICLGMQLLFENSEESQGVAGLGVLKGKIVRFDEKEGCKIPHMGWNSLHIKEGARLFEHISEDAYVYFVHSYYLQAEEPSIVTASCEYINQVHASVESGNIFACQFHPEKSSDVGLQILKNFLKIQKGER